MGDSWHDNAFDRQQDWSNHCPLDGHDSLLGGPGARHAFWRAGSARIPLAAGLAGDLSEQTRSRRACGTV